MGRVASEAERAFMEALLSRDFAGVGALREQWNGAAVRSSCNCGCGSFGFDFGESPTVTPSASPSPVPVEVEVLDEAGEVIGSIVVLLRERVLDDVDVFSFGEKPLAFPPPNRLRWPS